MSDGRLHLKSFAAGDTLRVFQAEQTSGAMGTAVFAARNGLRRRDRRRVRAGAGQRALPDEGGERHEAEQLFHLRLHLHAAAVRRQGRCGRGEAQRRQQRHILQPPPHRAGGRAQGRPEGPEGLPAPAATGAAGKSARTASGSSLAAQRPRRRWGATSPQPTGAASSARRTAWSASPSQSTRWTAPRSAGSTQSG